MYNSSREMPHLPWPAGPGPANGHQKQRRQCGQRGGRRGHGRQRGLYNNNDDNNDDNNDSSNTNI